MESSEPATRRGPRGRVFAIFGPSGSGKNTLMDAVLRSPAGHGLRQIPTVTTRAPRPGERDGVHHLFQDDATFSALEAAGAFLEWQPIHGYRFGMLRETVEERIHEGDAICDIDVHGVRALYAAFPENVVRVYLKPPSLEVLRERIQRRGEIDPAELELRLRRAQDEITGITEPDYDFLVLNDSLDEAIAAMRRIVADLRQFQEAEVIVTSSRSE